MRSIRWLAVVAGLAACSKPGTGAGTAAAPAAPIDLTLTDYAIAGPATIPAGYTTFRPINNGKEMHQAALVRLDSGKTFADFQTAVRTMAPDAKPPAWILWQGGPQQNGQVAIDLKPGNYVWYCIIPGADGMPHMAKGMMTPMTVTDSTNGAAAPKADIDVTLHDYQFDFSTPVTKGMHTLKVSVADGQPHEMVLVHLAPGKTAADMAAWAQKPDGPPPADAASGIALMQAGGTNYVTYDFTPGNYVAICFAPDAKDGKDHASHGMVKEFAIQ